VNAPRRVRLDLGYDGTTFAGWAAQPGQRTVQGVLEAALATVLRLDTPPATTVAGRTDAGVHARGQVAHVDLPEEAPIDALLRRLAGVLPLDVRVYAVAAAPPDFDARFSAVARHYAYRLSDAPWGVDPLRRCEVVRHARPLDVGAMAAAAAGLCGERDFAAYCRARAGATTVRAVHRFEWVRADGLVVGRVSADAFCHSQVRAMVGACLAVGEGRRPVQWPAQLLASRVRSSAVTVAPAHGLVLEAVEYPPDDQLGERATQARQRRVLGG
jgi:tRNA pseudouridine38-40 synthase